ncbi:hypothetical protein KRR39_15250 [Nocardioides panacis]|uniref:Uncharacterized protein n=1 Tax=Nocardioides panacis TaxID=2849501 RepID=A0A975SWQ5_9ACTN|nr:hypothetical protein [Nocardioides panacis]QWZ06870.1 hypothetical protein KRR39_15250 [Nocardioides panacis]
MTKKPPPRPLAPRRPTPGRPGPEARLPEPRQRPVERVVPPDPSPQPLPQPSPQPSPQPLPEPPSGPPSLPAALGDGGGRWAVLAVLLAVVVLTYVGLRAGPGLGSDGAAGPAPQDALGTRPPATLPAVGSFVESRIGADGRVHVVQWVRSGTPLRGLDLGLPAVPTVSRSVRAVDVRVTADGRPVPGPGTVGGPGAHVALPDAATTVAIRYTLEGLVERSSSARGRALVQATALEVRYGDRRGPTRVQVVSPGVLSLACVDATSTLPRPCGSPGSGRWNVELRGDAREDAVQAQVDLG